MTDDLPTRAQNKINDVIAALVTPGWRTAPGWGQWPGTTPDAWTTAEIVYVLTEIRQRRELRRTDPTLIEESLAFLVGEQHDDGGWGLDHSSATDTSLVSMVLAQHHDFEAQIDRALDYLAKEKHYDQELGRGGWAIVHGLESSASITSFIAIWLDIVRQNIGPNKIRLEHLTPARSFILARQNPDGGWGQIATDPSETKSTANAVHFLGRVYGDNESTQGAIHKGVKWLKQNFDGKTGCWGMGDIEVTAMGVLALLAIEESPRAPVISKAISYLLDHAEYEPQAIGWGKRPGERVETWVTFYVLLALIEYLDAVRDPENAPTKPLGRLTDLFYNRALTNVLLAVLFISALALLALGTTVNTQLQSFLTVIGTILGGLGVLYTLLRLIVTRQ